MAELAALKGPVKVSILSAAARDRHPEVRRAALVVLASLAGQLPPGHRRRSLERLFREIRVPRKAPTLVSVLLESQHPGVNALVVRELGRGSLQALNRALHPRFRATVPFYSRARLLQRIWSHRALRRTVLLRGLWAKAHPVVRRGVAETLRDHLEQLWELEQEALEEGLRAQSVWVKARYAELKEDEAIVSLAKQVQLRVSLRQLMRDREPEVALAAAHLQRVINPRYRIRGALLRYEGIQRKRLRGSRSQVEKVVLNSRIGALLWWRACLRPGAFGLCRRVRWTTRKGALASTRRVTYVRRNRALVRLARRHLRAAVRLWSNGRALLKIPYTEPDRWARTFEARRAVARAKLLLVDARLGAYLTLGIPRRLDFNPKHPKRARRSMKRFSSWLRTRLKQGARLIRDYLDVIVKVRILVEGKRRGDRRWSIAAMTRTALVFRDFAETLLRHRPPAFLKDRAARDAYGEQMQKFASPLLDKARIRYHICLNLARDLLWRDAWAVGCANGLAVTGPRKLRVRRAASAGGSPFPPWSMGGSLDGLHIRKTLADGIPAIRKCYSSITLAANPAQSGEVKVTFGISPRGGTTGVTVSSSTLKSAATVACIRKAMSAWVFPPHGGPTLQVRYRYRFAPGTGDRPVVTSAFVGPATR